LPDNRNIVIGGNIGKNKDTANEEAYQDYLTCFQKLYGLVDYFTLNVSSPNTPGLRALQEQDTLQKLLETIESENRKMSKHVPVFLKVAPDLSIEQVEEIAALLLQSPVSGLVVSNTTTAREPLLANQQYVATLGAGGLSGLPLLKRSRDITAQFAWLIKGKIPVISVGGINSGTEAKTRLDAGASLVQIYTSFIYSGPSLVKEIIETTA
jgi:dihydroorotate dehydrogenase